MDAFPTTASPPDAPPGAPRQGTDLRRRAIVSVVATLAILVAAGAAFVGLLRLRRPAERQATAPPLATVRVETLAHRDVTERFTGYGRAGALRAGEVSAEVGGLVAWVSPRCEAGEAIAAGEELVRLDGRDLDAALATATARHAQALAALDRARLDRAATGERVGVARQELAIAERELARLESLPVEAVSPSQVDAQRLQVSQRRHALLDLERQLAAWGPGEAQAEAEVAAAAAALDRATLDRARASIRAPWAGRVRARLVQEGARVAPGQAVVALVDTSRIEVPIALPARHHGEVAPGAAVTLRAATDDAPAWHGTIARVAPAIDDADRTFFVYAVVTGATPDADAPIAPGAFVIGEVEGPTHRGALAVPRAAFVGDRCYVAAPSHVVAWVAAAAAAPTPEARVAQASAVDAGAAAVARALGTVPGCGPAAVEPAGAARRVVAPIVGAEPWAALAARAREALGAPGAVSEGCRVSVAIEAVAAERAPHVVRRLPEAVLVDAGLAPGELLVITNLERVGAGARVRLADDAPEHGGAAK